MCMHLHLSPREVYLWGYCSFYARDVSWFIGIYRGPERSTNAGAPPSRYRYARSAQERILTALTSHTLIIRNCFPDDNTLRMRAFLKNQTGSLHLSEVSFPSEMEMRGGESPDRLAAFMDKRKPIVYFQKRGNQGRWKRKGGHMQNINFLARTWDPAVK